MEWVSIIIGVEGEGGRCAASSSGGGGCGGGCGGGGLYFRVRTSVYKSNATLRPLSELSSLTWTSGPCDGDYNNYRRLPSETK